MYWIELIAGLISIVLLALMIWIVVERFKY